MMFDQPHVDLAITLKITDVRAFVRAARARAIAEGESPKGARETYKATDLAACAVMLIDPGKSPTGSEILETNAEAF